MKISLKTSIIAFILLLLIMLLSSAASAATIYGTVYDDSLSIADASVELNTIPLQRDITDEGRYSFNITQGDYTITAIGIHNENLKAEENITIAEDGSYRIDLILFSSLDDDILNTSDIVITDVLEEESIFNPTTLIILGSILFIMTLIYLAVKAKKRREKKEKGNKQEKDNEKESSETDEETQYDKDREQEEDISQDQLKDILKFIKKEQGRTTQKEIRKAFPLSEAKVSLMIAELEEKGKIKKIKKGRANIIILNKEKSEKGGEE